ncbi:MAG: hypothetical protein ACREIQ_04560 [Nitrospiria bacterium]
MPKFFETFNNTSGLSWITGEEKELLVNADVALPVLSVGEGPGYQPGTKQYYFVTELDGEARAIGFGAGSVESRDRMFVALQEFLEQEDAETPLVKVIRSGRSLLLVNAEDE